MACSGKSIVEFLQRLSTRLEGTEIMDQQNQRRNVRDGDSQRGPQIVKRGLRYDEVGNGVKRQRRPLVDDQFI